MNLKNSRFYKRIQYLRHITRTKQYIGDSDNNDHQKPDRTKVDRGLDNVFQEPSGNVYSRAADGYRCQHNTINNTSPKKPPISKIKKKLTIKHPLAISSDEKEQDAANNNNNDQRNDVIDYTANSFIQLNSVRFRVKCPRMQQLTCKKPELGSKKTKSRSAICLSYSRYNMIGKISKAIGYKVVKESKLWNVLWMDSVPGVELYKNMKRFQQINHFPGTMEICRKDLLSRNLNRMLKLFPKDYKIFPKTWVFPADYGEAVHYSTIMGKNRCKTYIIKPDSGCQGRGIWLTKDLKGINQNERMICQCYIEKPLLIDGYKFDLRVYTLITSVDPLRIFVYNEGLARFATSKYVEPTTDNNTDLYMHLTNYSVNKRNSQYELCANDDCGSKRTFSAINNWLKSRNYDVDAMWSRIDDIIIKTVLSALPMLKHNYHACFPAHDRIQACFEILGFDILVDSNLKPYILEVNHSPSFHMSEEVDRQVKRALIRDTLKLACSAMVDKRQILREDRKRVKQRLLKSKSQSNYRFSGSGGDTTVHDDSITESSPPSALSLQIAWEESNLGDFRRIMPAHEPHLNTYYSQFYALQNQASIYSETAASKKREDLAKQLRMELETRRAKQVEIIKSHASKHLKFEESRERRAKLSRSVVEKKLKANHRLQASWLPGYISEAEERLRRSWLQMRGEMLRSAKVVQTVYFFLHSIGCLTNADVLRYPMLHDKLTKGIDIINEEF